MRAPNRTTPGRAASGFAFAFTANPMTRVRVRFGVCFFFQINYTRVQRSTRFANYRIAYYYFRYYSCYYTINLSCREGRGGGSCKSYFLYIFSTSVSVNITEIRTKPSPSPVYILAQSRDFSTGCFNSTFKWNLVGHASSATGAPVGLHRGTQDNRYRSVPLSNY